MKFDWHRVPNVHEPLTKDSKPRIVSAFLIADSCAKVAYIKLEQRFGSAYPSLTFYTKANQDKYWQRYTNVKEVFGVSKYKCRIELITPAMILDTLSGSFLEYTQLIKPTPMLYKTIGEICGHKPAVTDAPNYFNGIDISTLHQINELRRIANELLKKAEQLYEHAKGVKI